MERRSQYARQRGDVPGDDEVGGVRQLGCAERHLLTGAQR